jgi:hypothetical protein
VRTRWRVLIGLGAVLVVWVGVWLWQSTGAPPRKAKTKQPSSQVTLSRGSADPLTGAPRWLGQTGVQGRPVAGIVVGEDGAPLAGATVRVANTFTMAGLVTVPSKTTGADGRFDFGPQPAATYVVSAELPKLTSAFLRTDLRNVSARPASDQLRLVMHPCDASIHGTVFDTAEGAIGGATIMRVERGLATAAGAIADDKGSFELCVPAGGAEVIVSADGYAAVEESVNVFGRTKRDFQLAPGTSVTGRTVRADDKSPVAGAIVELRSADPRDNEAPLSTASRADGTFSFDSVASGRHVITALAERMGTQEPVELTTSIGTPTTDIVCELAATYVVSGRVVERDSKKPVVGRAVFLTSRNRSPMDWSGRSYAMTQADGSFTIDHARTGEYQLFVDGSDRDKRETVKVETADVTDLLIEVEAGAQVSGRVLAGGKPVDGVMVRVGRPFANSEADGTYVIRGIEPGTHELYAESHRIGAFTKGREITLAAGEDKKGVDIELDLSGSVSGVVVDQNGAPVPGVFLSFSLVHGRDFGSATTADDGSFTARSLSGGGDYVYEVKQRDQASLTLPPASGKRHPPVTVKDGQTHVTGLRVAIRYDRLAISGRVLDTAGKPVADAKVQAVPSGTEWFRVPATTSAEGGGFTIADLPAGSYTVKATGAQGEGSAPSVAAGTKNVAIRLVEPGGIDGTLKGFTGTPEVNVFRFEQRFDRRRATVSGTTFSLRDLPPGRYALAATAGLDTARATVEVTAGEIKTVVLEVRATGIVTGKVFDKAHSPISGLSCMAALQGQDEMMMGGPSDRPRSDATGAFRIERAPVGDVMVGCYGRGISAWTQAKVTVAQVTTVELTAAPREANDDSKRRKSGLTLENQLSEVLVKSVEPDSPAAKAGIAPGDVVVKVENETLGRFQAEMAMRMIEYGESNPVKIVLERNEKQVSVSITF